MLDPVSAERYFTTSGDGKTYLKIAPGESFIRRGVCCNFNRYLGDKLKMHNMCVMSCLCVMCVMFHLMSLFYE